jgi:hypothetical protein
MAIISQDLYEEQCRSKTILHFCKDFKLARLLEQSNIRKAKGIGVLTVFVHLLTVAFSGKSLNQTLADGELSEKKDVFYRFLNSTSANWMKFVRLLAASIIVRLKAFFSDDLGVLIIDDTVHKRNRSKKVELLTRVRDHTDGRYYKGFRCLSLCYQIARTIVPVDFRILSSFNEKTRINGSRMDLDKRTNAYKIRQYAMSNTFEMVFDLLNRQRGLVRHVLFDSWFAKQTMFEKLRDMGFHGIGMLQAARGRHFRYKGNMYSLSSLYAIAKLMIHRNKGFAALGVEFENGTFLSITFVKDKSTKRGWYAIATTDSSLSPREVLTLYARRWDIEVFFKTVKSYLGFARECQSRSFDAVVCSVAIVFTRHIMLTWMNLGLPVPETDGQLFFRLFDEMRECTFQEALDIVIREAAILFVDSDESDNISILEFLRTLPSYFKPLLAVA